ncbi:hypothetical protein BDW22DRAFT_1342613 [Trametopsis cervina]|nr:hypothetical protein BDW22DRAFT_1342613 [Trametopsis cervina]
MRLSGQLTGGRECIGPSQRHSELVKPALEVADLPTSAWRTSSSTFFIFSPNPPAIPQARTTQRIISKLRCNSLRSSPAAVSAAVSPARVLGSASFIPAICHRPRFSLRSSWFSEHAKPAAARLLAPHPHPNVQGPRNLPNGARAKPVWAVVITAGLHATSWRQTQARTTPSKRYVLHFHRRAFHAVNQPIRTLLLKFSKVPRSTHDHETPSEKPERGSPVLLYLA